MKPASGADLTLNQTNNPDTNRRIAQPNPVWDAASVPDPEGKRDHWALFYSDGTVFTHEDGAPHEAPPVGLLVAMGYDNELTPYHTYGWDHYRFDIATKQWWGMNLFGVFDTLKHGEVYAYKEGRCVSVPEFQAVLKKARAYKL